MYVLKIRTGRLGAKIMKTELWSNQTAQHETLSPPFTSKNQ